jgi:hypothetical protein
MHRCHPGAGPGLAGHALCVLLAFLAGAGTPAVAALKCWTNKDGVRECGAVVPPEYVGQGHEEVNRLGVKVHEQGRAMTAEEFAAKREADRQAQAEAEREAALRAQRAQEDLILLETFASEDDILLARDGRIAAVDAEMRFARSTVEKLRADLDRRIAEAAAHERKGEPVPEGLQADIAEVRGQIEAQQAFIEQKRQEQQRISDEHEVLRARYVDLRARERASERADESRH